MRALCQLVCRMGPAFVPFTGPARPRVAAARGTPAYTLYVVLIAKLAAGRPLPPEETIFPDRSLPAAAAAEAAAEAAAAAAAAAAGPGYGAATNAEILGQQAGDAAAGDGAERAAAAAAGPSRWRWTGRRCGRRWTPRGAGRAASGGSGPSAPRWSCCARRPAPPCAPAPTSPRCCPRWASGCWARPSSACGPRWPPTPVAAAAAAAAAGGRTRGAAAAAAAAGRGTPWRRCWTPAAPPPRRPLPPSAAAAGFMAAAVRAALGARSLSAYARGLLLELFLDLRGWPLPPPRDLVAEQQAQRARGFPKALLRHKELEYYAACPSSGGCAGQLIALHSNLGIAQAAYGVLEKVPEEQVEPVRHELTKDWHKAKSVYERRLQELEREAQAEEEEERERRTGSLSGGGGGGGGAQLAAGALLRRGREHRQEQQVAAALREAHYRRLRVGQLRCLVATGDHAKAYDLAAALTAAAEASAAGEEGEGEGGGGGGPGGAAAAAAAAAGRGSPHTDRLMRGSFGSSAALNALAHSASAGSMQGGATRPLSTRRAVSGPAEVMGGRGRAGSLGHQGLALGPAGDLHELTCSIEQLKKCGCWAAARRRCWGAGRASAGSSASRTGACAPTGRTRTRCTSRPWPPSSTSATTRWRCGGRSWLPCGQLPRQPCPGPEGTEGNRSNP